MTVTDTAHDSTIITRFYGPSTETKPLRAMIGAVFTETDTKRQFFFDGATWIRSSVVTVEQAAPVVVEKISTTDDLLLQILVQLKILNVHQSLINDEELRETDIPLEVA